MDDSEVDDPEASVGVWRMFHEPLMALFTNLDQAEEGLSTLMTSIINSKSDFSNVLVPHQLLSSQEKQYAAFNKWLLGRLFYILSNEKLESIHSTSIVAQLKILSILFTNEAVFFDDICQEYVSILSIIVNHCYEISYKDNIKPLEFEMLSPASLEISIPNLDLSSVKIIVSSIKVCKTLIKCLMDIFCQMLICTRDLQFTVDSKNILRILLFVLEHLDYDLKSFVIEFFTNLFKYFGLSSDWICTHNFFQMLENLILQLINMKYDSILQYRQIDILNNQLIYLFTTVTQLGLCTDCNTNSIILNICKVVLISDKNTDNFIDSDASSIPRIDFIDSPKVFTSELKHCCTQLINKLFCSDVAIIFDERNSVEYIQKFPSLIISKIMSDLDINLKFACNKANNIEMITNSNLFRSILLLLRNSLENSCNDDVFIMNNHLDICLSILNVFENFRIEFLNRSQQEFDLFDNVFFSNNLTIEKLVELRKIQILKFIPKDLSASIVRGVVSLFKFALNSFEKPLAVLFKLMELVMLLLTLSSEIKYEDLKILLEIECFSLTNDTDCSDELPSNLFSSDSHNKIHIHTLHILLMHNICRNNMLMSEFLKKKILEFTESLDVNNETILLEILECSPLLILNKIMSPAQLINTYIHPVLISKKENLIQELITVLPVIVCSLYGHYVIIQSEEMRHTIDCEYKLSSLDGLHINFICLHCYNSNKTSSMQQSFKYQMAKNKIMILAEKSQLIYQEQNNLLNKFHALFIKQFLDLKFYRDIPIALVSKFVFTLASHHILAPETYKSLMSENNLVHILHMFRPFITNVLNDSRFDVVLKTTVLQSSTDLLLRTTKRSLETNDMDLQNTCLEAIRQFGMGPYDKVILPTMKLLIYFVMISKCPYGPKAIFYIKDICEYHNVSTNRVYHRYKKDLCRIMMELTLYNYLLGQGFAASILKVIRAFGFLGYKDFVSKDMHHALPYIIPDIVKSERLRPILTEIASLIHCAPADFVNERFPHIYTYIYMNKNDDEICECIKFIENVTNEQLLDLVKKHSRIILTELLLQSCCDPQKVINACMWLTKINGNLQRNTTILLSQVADYIQPRFLGVLAYFDTKLVHVKIALSVKRKALASLPHLLNLMGPKYLTPLRFKILGTLRTALSLKEFPELNADAWNAFIKNMDASVLGSLLTTVFISLLPLLPYASSKVNELFKYLVDSNGNLLSDHIADLFFVQETDVDENIKYIVAQHVSKSIPDTFIKKIKWYMKYLNQDNVELKVYTLKYLHTLIKNHRTDLDSAIFESKNVNSLIVELLDKLITGYQDSDNHLADWSGRCLGQLGALQPSLLPKRPAPIRNIAPFAFSINDLCFVKTALFELARAFQIEKYTKDMDCYSLAIQEILNIFNICPDGKNKDLWNSFPTHIHQIMVPLLSSRYTLGFAFSPVQVSPIFGTEHSATFNDWALSWASQLIPLVNDASTQNMLHMAYPALKKDLRTLIIFLPYIVLETILSDNENTIIKDEIMTIIQLRSFRSMPVNKIKSPKLRMMRSVNLIPGMSPLILEEGTHIKCCKMVYNLIDFLHRWMGEWCHIKKKSISDNKYKNVESFVKIFCKLTIAQGNFLCGDLERALMYLEMYMDESPSRLQEQLGFLAEIYAVLNEPDAVSGILSIKVNEPSLSELILAHEVTGQLQDAATCYEKYAQQGDIDSERLQGMVKIYLGLNQPFTALKLLQGADEMDFHDEAMAAEPFWRLGMFEDLEKLLKQPEVVTDDRWGVSIGHCLLALRGGMRDSLEEKLKLARSAIRRRLDEGSIYTSAEESIYSRAYSSAFNLHMITEIEHMEDAVYRIKSVKDVDTDCTSIVDNLIMDWNLRFKLIQSSAGTVEPVLRLRRILLEQSKQLLNSTHPVTASTLDVHIGKLWMQSAKFARKAAIFQQAYIYILNGEKYAPKELFIEKAKLYWMRGQQEPAFCTLKRGLEEHFTNITNLSVTDRKLCAKAKLLIATYNDETNNVDMDVNISYYQAAHEVYKQWEKSLVCLGGYYERVYAALSPSAKLSFVGGKARLNALECYGRSLRYGQSKLYQSMPRLLSIWLDFEQPSADSRLGQSITPSQICKSVDNLTESLPLYLFFTAFNQIISRICHPNKEVYNQLKSIIVKLILAFPQHSLWMMMCVIKSDYPQRINRCQEILHDKRLKSAHMQKFILDFNQLAVNLIKLCNTTVIDNDPVIQVSKLVNTLPPLLASKNFSEILMPHEKFIKMLLPRNSLNKVDSFNFIPFPSAVYIAGIEEDVTIITSLQKPRKVTLKGSDGKKYIIMLKPNDDLRKDFRLMEFNAVVNRYLQESSDARERRLYIRTYTVLPLNEMCGLIQWIPNLLGLRPILMQIYKNKGINISSTKIRQNMCNKKDSLEKKRDLFENKLLPMHPPVFGEWFRFNFPDPHSWYQARSAYVRTTAVMSMVGYILGLGDRHGENILFDSTNGDTVHVDFNCLFNKGERFDWPEKVPFRLTQNMRAAMGPLGYEGMFRKCCEITIRVLQGQTATLMSVIRPFVYDPLVTWNFKPGRKELIELNTAEGEKTNKSAFDDLTDIEQRLRGTVRSQGKQQALSLSPEGQTNNLILEATSPSNLCQMYIGWGPYL